MSGDVKQEPDGIPSKLIVFVGIGALFVFAVGIIWAIAIQRGDTGTLVNEPTSTVEHARESEVGIVYMRPFEEDYAKRAHARDRRRLESLGWADKEQRVAHIPLERAIQILVEREAKK